MVVCRFQPRATPISVTSLMANSARSLGIGGRRVAVINVLFAGNGASLYSLRLQTLEAGIPAAWRHILMRGRAAYPTDTDIESLAIYAGVHVREHGLYRMLSKRFPYAVYYEIGDQTVYVIAVLPMRRDPAWLKTSLRERS